MRVLTIQEVEFLAHRLAKELMAYDEPIPDLSSRFPKVLESCLGAPFQSYSKRDLYPSISDKAAILFYLMIKNHPFQNGNKRVAVTSLLVFFYLNKKWLKIPKEQLYRVARWVAESEAEFKDGVMLAIKKLVKKNLIDVDNN